MPEFVSKPRLKEGIEPSSPRDLVPKGYVDNIFGSADGGGPGLGIRLHISVDAGTIA